jgi:hypothetical protein
MAGETRVSVKTKKLPGKAFVRGGAGTATRTVLLAPARFFVLGVRARPPHRASADAQNVNKDGFPRQFARE